MEGECNSLTECTGFSFSADAAEGTTGCFKKCGKKEFAGYGYGSHDYWLKPATPKTASKKTASKKTAFPTRYPTAFPTRYPTAFPTRYPTSFPTSFPTSSDFGETTIAKCNAAVYKSKGGSCADGDGSGCGWGTYHFQERAQRNMFVIALSQIFRALTHTPPSFSPQTTRSLQVPLHRRQNEIAVQGELQQPLGEWLVAWQRAQGLPRHLRRVGPQGRPEEDCPG